jgi:hypothetical protein
MRLKGLLAFNAAEIDSNSAVVGGEDRVATREQRWPPGCIVE